METLKNLLAVLVALIGVISAMLTLYAKYLDVKNTAKGEPSGTPPPPPTEPHFDTPAGSTHFNVPTFEPAYATSNPVSMAVIRSQVKAPAIALIVFGAISFFTNIAVSSYGLIDQFVTPLSEESARKHALLNAGPNPSFIASPGMNSQSTELSDPATSVLVSLVFLGCAAASLVAIGAAVGMLQLKGYWFSVAGSVAIIAGGLSLCCIGGIPIGVWSLVVLNKPAVSASFR